MISLTTLEQKNACTFKKMKNKPQDRKLLPIIQITSKIQQQQQKSDWEESWVGKVHAAQP